MTTTRGRLALGITYAGGLWGELHGQVCGWHHAELLYLGEIGASVPVLFSRAASDSCDY